MATGMTLCLSNMYNYTEEHTVETFERNERMHSLINVLLFCPFACKHVTPLTKGH